MQFVFVLLCTVLIGKCAVIESKPPVSTGAVAQENKGVAAANPEQKTCVAAVVIAACDSPGKIKEQADFVCPGTNDHIVINAAIAALPTPGGRVHLAAGNYSIGGVDGTRGGINILRENIVFSGEGSGTRLTLQSGLIDVNVIWIHGDICDVTVRDLYINGNGKNQNRTPRDGWKGCNGIKAIDKSNLGPTPRNIRVENCHIENCRLMAVMLTGDMMEVLNCYFTGDFGSHVIELLGASGRIEGCTVRVREGEVVNMGWATDACDYYHIVNNKLFVDKGGVIQGNAFQNWPPRYYSGGARTNHYHGIISGNMFVNEGKSGPVLLRGYLDIINNNIIRGMPTLLGVKQSHGGGMWVNFEHNMLINSSLTIDSPFIDDECFIFINGNGFINSPVNHKSGTVIWGTNPGHTPSTNVVDITK